MKVNEVPIGCVIVHNDEIIGRGYNRRMVDKNTLSHAELNAIKKQAESLMIGGLMIAKCMLQLSHVRCVQEQ